MNKTNRTIVIGVIVAASLIGALCFFPVAGKNLPVQTDTGYRPVMGTFARVVGIAADSSTAAGFPPLLPASANKASM